MKVPTSLSNSDFDLPSRRQQHVDALADAIAAVVREAQRSDFPRELVIEAIKHVWPEGERH